MRFVLLVAASLAVSACASKPTIMMEPVYVYPARVGCPKPPPVPDADSPSLTERTVAAYLSDLYLVALLCYKNVQAQNAQLDAMVAAESAVKKER